MTFNLPGQSPIESESQRIGRYATKCFGAHIPNSWIAEDMSGDGDYGIDFLVQTSLGGSIRSHR